VFKALEAQGDGWLPRLLRLCHAESNTWTGLDLTITQMFYWPEEKRLDPPISLLSWLIRNLPPQLAEQSADEKRRRLGKGDPRAVEEALRLLRTVAPPRAWHIFEGTTSPDVVIQARDALVVIEGKRSEPDATADTRWLAGRHQMWRHIDAAWELRGSRKVFGFFIVESQSGGVVPNVWQEAFKRTLSAECLASSFPHRSAVETAAISKCFLGGTTWQQVCKEFGLDHDQLPHTTSG
jgi:hypothetical protein